MPNGIFNHKIDDCNGYLNYQQSFLNQNNPAIHIVVIHNI